MSMASASDSTATTSAPHASIAPGEPWCCIPVYNNAATIEEIAVACRKLLDNVVIVDDGSMDINVAATLAEHDVTVLVHTQNRGKGEALRTGFEYIQQQGGRYAITLDGDGQHFPKDIPAFFSKLDPNTLVLGKRAYIEGEMPTSSLFGREFSDFWIELETGTKPCDTQSGFRAYPLEAIEKLGVTTRHYNFEVEAVTRALWAGMAVCDVPISVWYPPADERVSSFDHRKDNFRLARLHTKLALRQLLPLPHRKITEKIETSPQPRASWWKRNTSPAGLALAAGLSLLLPLMHGLLGALAIAYILWRWHLNALATLAGAAVGCAIYHQHTLVYEVGRWLVAIDASASWTWFVGSHVVGPVAGVLAGIVVYKVARKYQPLQRQSDRQSEVSEMSAMSARREP